MIELLNVTKTYSGRRAVSSVNLNAEDGQTTVLIGPSGCGKSTLLRLIVGLIEPDSGDIRIDGIGITRDNIDSVRKRIGYVIQEGGLFPNLNAYQNISVMARYLGWSKSDIDNRVKELASLTRYPEDALGRFPLRISGGQRQRVSLMRALMLDPDILIMDEPLGALDPLIRAGLQSDLKNIFAELGKTVLLVTHDMGEAAFLGDKIALIRAGEIVQQGVIGDLDKRPSDKFVTEFINAQRRTLDFGDNS